MGDEPSNQLNGIAKVRKMRTTGKQGNPIGSGPKTHPLTPAIPRSGTGGRAPASQRARRPGSRFRPTFNGHDFVEPESLDLRVRKARSNVGVRGQGSGRDRRVLMASRRKRKREAEEEEARPQERGSGRIHVAVVHSAVLLALLDTRSGLAELAPDLQGGSCRRKRPLFPPFVPRVRVHRRGYV